MKAPDWTDRAECRDMETALFYPGNHGIGTEAVQACQRCRVVAECLAEANQCEGQTKAEVFGYRAGMTAIARLEYRRNLKQMAS